MLRRPLLLLLALSLTRCAGTSDAAADAGSAGPDASADAAAAPDAEPSPDAAAEPSDGGVTDAEPRDTGLRTAWAWAPITPDDPAIVGRWGAIVADRGDGVALLFGGTDVDATQGRVYDDTWLIDTREGSPRFFALEAPGPSARYCGCMAWDPVRLRAILFGGRSASFRDTAPETWAFDATSVAWSRFDTTAAPFGVIGCAMAYAPATDSIYLFGGASERRGFSGETWRLDLATNAWSRVEPPAGTAVPEARYDAVLRCLGQPCERLVLFGGAGLSGNRPAPHDDVWTFDPRTDTWAEVTTSSTITPGGRRTPFVAVEPSGEHLVAGYGVRNLDGSGPYADLWRFELATGAWERLAPDLAPGPRGFALALPGGEGTVGMLLGGFDGSAPVREAHLLWPPSDGRWR